MNATENRIGNFSKVCRLGSAKDVGNTFVKIEFKDGKLSISGVEGPKANGDCRGGCGQIVMSGLSVEEYAPGWDAEKVQRFAEVWDHWHLNDMRAGCEHQRAEDWGNEELEVVTYGLTSEAHKLRREALDESAAAARDGRVANLTETGKALLSDDWFKDRHSPPDADSPLSGCYEVKRREKKRANWVNQAEHPRGVLSKPCPVCGYKFGTKWLREEVPQEVIEFLQSLPDTDTKPAWV
jgi:hypothetical protein